MLEADEYSIEYVVATNDAYLMGLEIENPNPTAYTSTQGAALTELEVPGYIFEGWYDGEGSGAARVTSIA